MSSLQTIFPPNPAKQCSPTNKPSSLCSLSWNTDEKKKKRHSTVVAAVGDVSADGTAYLIAGAAVVALLGTGFPILFSRKDM